MKLKDIAPLNEGMSFWIPDAEKNKIAKKCPRCDGTGVDEYESDEDCWGCYGKGEVQVADVDYEPLDLGNRNARLVTGNALLRYLVFARQW